jgi:hypothetical protein
MRNFLQPPSVFGWKMESSVSVLSSSSRLCCSRHQSAPRCIRGAKLYSSVAKVRRSPAFSMRRETFVTDAVVLYSPSSTEHSCHPNVAWVSRQQPRLLAFTLWASLSEPARWTWRAVGMDVVIVAFALSVLGIIWAAFTPPWIGRLFRFARQHFVKALAALLCVILAMLAFAFITLYGH